MSDIHVFQDEEAPEFWRVEETDDENGVCAIALFAGQNAERHAREYAQWLKSRARVGPAIIEWSAELVLSMAQPRKRSSLP
jgi:hypothetical protein